MFTRFSRAGGALLAVLSLCAAAPLLAAPKVISSRVQNVTLYRGQALVTRSVAIESDQRTAEVVVSDLPANVQPDSLFAEGGEAVDVRAVRYRARAVGEEPREEVRKLDDAIQDVNDKLSLNQKTQELLQKRSQYLDKLEGFVAPTANVELSKGVLNAESLEKLTQFSFDQRTKAATETVAAMKEARELQAQLSLLQRRRAELASGANREVREAVLFLELRKDGKQQVKLSYLVSGCGWSPTYTYRAKSGQPEIEIEYNALIHQMSGEDWQDVDLTLSTASPALSSAGPGLAPFRVSLAHQSAQQTAQSAQPDVRKKLSEIQGRQQMAIEQYNNAFRQRDNLGSNWDINSIANDLQQIELTGGKDSLRALQGVQEGGDGPSMSYHLAGGVSLASRSDQQMVRILQTNLKSRFYYVATPVLTSYVYREAELTNSSKDDLLGGPITVYLDGRFVGRSEVGAVARGQSFVVGFGADPQLRAHRELANKDDKIQGGNREMAFSYRLVIENFKDTPVTVRLLDRLPHSERDSEIRITTTMMDVPLSTDPLYERVEKPKGILRWEVDVPANAAGEKAKIVSFDYAVEFDRTLYLATPASLSDQQREFEKLQMLRNRK